MSVRGVALALAAFPAVLRAQTADQHAQPPPEFTNYRIPVERAALPRDGTFQYVDLAILAVVLLLTAWIVLSRRSRKELRIVSAFSLAYFGFYRLGCVCSIGSVQNVVYAASHGSYRLPLPVAGFFVLPLVASLFFGRVFCGGACPMGAMQDLLLFRSIRLPASLSAILGTVPYIYLGSAVLFAATGTAYVICEYDPFVSMFRLSGHFLIVVFGALMLVTSTFIGRPYCRFLCPYSVLLRWCSHFAKYRVSVSPKDCIQCHLCASACPFQAITPPSVETRNRTASRRRLAMLLLLTPILILAFASIGWRLSPVLASWDLRVHRARVLRLAELRPSPQKTVIADAWDRHRQTAQDAYREGAAVEQQFAIGAPILGAWVGLVLSMAALYKLRRDSSTDYQADSGACVSCARCYASCPVSNRGFPLPNLPIVNEREGPVGARP
jgi:polyferredoxin